MEDIGVRADRCRKGLAHAFDIHRTSLEKVSVRRAIISNTGTVQSISMLYIRMPELT